MEETHDGPDEMLNFPSLFGPFSGTKLSF